MALRSFLFLLFGLFLVLQEEIGSGHAAPISHLKKETFSSVLSYKDLFSIPQRKGTVGTLLFYKKNNVIYVLLGREDSTGTTSKAGQYCDLGGSLKLDGTTIAQNLIRELQEESAGAFAFTPRYLKSSVILYKETENHRDIYYAFLLLSSSQFLSAERLEAQREIAKDEQALSSYLEKDKFLWIRLDDLLNSFKKNHSYWGMVRDIEGTTHHIRLREFFVKDCLTHPDFQKSVQRLLGSLKQRHQKH